MHRKLSRHSSPPQVLQPSLSSLLVLLGAACSGSYEGPLPEQDDTDEPGELGQTVQEIVNGQDDDPKDYTVKVVRGSTLCTGTLLRNNIVLTAAHCVGTVSGGQWNTHTVSNHLGQSANIASAANLVEHPSADIAIGRLNASLPINSQTQGKWTELHYGPPSELVGETVVCRGYGNFTCNSQSGTQRWAGLNPSAASATSLIYEPNLLGQILIQGDSGGPCFWDFGVVVGVTRTASCSTAKQTPVSTYADWINEAIGNFSTSFFTSFNSALDLNLFDVIVPSAIQGGPVNWFIQNGALVENSNVQGIPPSAEGSGTHALVKGQVVADGWIVTEIYSPDDDTGGLIVRYQNEFDMYRFLATENVIRFEKVVDGVVTVLGTSPFGGVNWANGVELRVLAQGDSFLLFVDGSLHFSVTDSTYRTGRAGLHKRALEQSQFLHFEIDHNDD